MNDPAVATVLPAGLAPDVGKDEGTEAKWVETWPQN
jgi:hypothetical protein